MVRSIKGRELDFEVIIKQHSKDIALGNASMNARGDIVKNGKVVKTVEERRKEYYQLNPLDKQTEILINQDLMRREEATKTLEEAVKERSPKPKKSTEAKIDEDFTPKIKKSEKEIDFEE